MAYLISIVYVRPGTRVRSAGEKSMELFVKSSEINVSADDLFAWHLRPGAFERLTPPWDATTVMRRSGPVAEGSRVELLTRVGPIPVRIEVVHEGIVPGREFCDVMVRGPFSHWHHAHKFLPLSDATSVLEDRISYRLPLGILGSIFGGKFTRRKLDSLFDYRHAVTQWSVAKVREEKPMRVLVSGASGLIGSALIPLLTTRGHTVTRLVRNNPGDSDVLWNPKEGTVDPPDLSDFDAVIHLAAEPISQRWTPEQMDRIRESRTQGTKTIANAIKASRRPPRVLISASAMGYYGNRGSELLTEESGRGEGFLSEVAEAWEAATEPAAIGGTRVAIARFSLVLTPQGGAFKKLLPLFKLGLGGRMGSGDQYWSWIAIDDVVLALHHLLTQPELSGPFNIASTQPATNAEFTRTLARVLGRPAIFPIPTFAAKLVAGSMVDDLLFSSARLAPEKLIRSGFMFRLPELDGAFRHLLGK